MESPMQKTPCQDKLHRGQRVELFGPGRVASTVRVARTHVQQPIKVVIHGAAELHVPRGLRAGVIGREEILQNAYLCAGAARGRFGEVFTISTLFTWRRLRNCAREKNSKQHHIHIRRLTVTSTLTRTSALRSNDLEPK